MKLLHHPARLFALASLVFGLGLAIVTPPFQVPDEPAHFYRAYLVSEGRLRWVPDGSPRAEVPESLTRLVDSLIGQTPFPPERTVDPGEVVDALAMPLEPARRVLAVFPSGLQYTFVAYLPQAAGIAIARLFGAPALGLLYAARLTNLLAGTLAVWAAIRLLPALRWPAVLLAMMPMTLALRASASIDAITVGVAFLLTAAAARLIWGEGAPRRCDLAVLAAATAVLCVTKPPYLSLALLVCLVPAARWPQSPGRAAGRRRLACLLGYFTLLGGLVTWSVVTARSVGVVRPDAGVDSERQMAAMIADPFRVLGLVAADYVEHTPRYLAHFVGHLGWLDVRPPVWLLVSCLALLLAVTLLDTEGVVIVTWRQRAAIGAVVVAGILLVSASQYASFTPLGAAYIDGIQGRYFLPLAPAGMWVLRGGAVAPRTAGAPRMPALAVPVAVAVFVALAFAMTVAALLDRFYGI